MPGASERRSPGSLGDDSRENISMTSFTYNNLAGVRSLSDGRISWQARRERNSRGELTSDRCVLDDKHFFILGRILLPVIDGPGPFAWLAWVSLSEKNFLGACEIWHSEGRETVARRNERLRVIFRLAMGYGCRDTAGMSVDFPVLQSTQCQAETPPGRHLGFRDWQGRSALFGSMWIILRHPLNRND